jgi:hypothetical protein
MRITCCWAEVFLLNVLLCMQPIMVLSSASVPADMAGGGQGCLAWIGCMGVVRLFLCNLLVCCYMVWAACLRSACQLAVCITSCLYLAVAA